MIGIDPDRPEMRAAQGEHRSFGRIAAIGVFVPQKIYLMKTGKEGKGDRTMDETNVNDRQAEQAQDRLLFFRLAEDGEELCSGTCYQALLDYMAARCDRFMLAYVLADGEKMSAEMRHIEQQLRPYRLFYRRTGGWPGAIFDHSIVRRGTTYRVTFYRLCAESMAFLHQADGLFSWMPPDRPQDLGFYLGKKCRFYSSGVARIAAFCHATDDDLAFADKNALAAPEDLFIPKDDSISLYDEKR